MPCNARSINAMSAKLWQSLWHQHPDPEEFAEYVKGRKKKQK